MDPADLRAFTLVGFLFALVALLWLIHLLFLRERVKQAIFDRGFIPLQVRWIPFAYWAGLSTGFFVSFSDTAGAIQTSRCRVTPLYSRVHWINCDIDYLHHDLRRIGQIVYTLIALLLLRFAISAAMAHQLFLAPNPFTFPNLQHPQGHHLHGLAKNLLAAAAFSGAVSLLTQVLYQHTSRQHPTAFRRLARTLSIAAWTLFWLSIIKSILTQP
jgi:hypothetical protein